MNKHIQKIQKFVKNSPFRELSGFEIETITEGELTAKINLTNVFRRHDGVAHGGYVSYFADTIMGFAALTLVTPEQTVYTAEMKVSFLNPGYGDHMFGKAYVIRSGKTVHFCEAEIYGYNTEGEKYLAAKASSTMIVAAAKV